MSDSVVLRPATTDDAAAIRAIYAPFVENTAVSFEEDVPNVAEMQRRIAASLEKYGYYVATLDGQVVGYAYGSAYRPRHAYRFTAEVSVYVDPKAHGHRIGRRLYQTLIDGLKDRGFHAALGVATQPNAASVALHKAMGFNLIGTTPEVGHKFGKWHGVDLFYKIL